MRHATPVQLPDAGALAEATRLRPAQLRDCLHAMRAASDDPQVLPHHLQRHIVRLLEHVPASSVLRVLSLGACDSQFELQLVQVLLEHRRTVECVAFMQPLASSTAARSLAAACTG